MPVKTTPIKTDLFKFITLRTPQLIDAQKKDLGFIFHSDDTGVFLSSIANEVNITKARNYLNDEAKQFTPIEKIVGVKNINGNIYEFSSWLMRNRNTIVKAASDTKIAEVVDPSLTNAQKNVLWDNLYYQALTRKSSYVRQACIQMLIAYNYLAKSTSYDSKSSFTEEEYLNRLANAKVVINKAFTKEKKQQVKNKIVSNRVVQKLKNET